jgi:LacI family transcriptional regulator
MKFDRKILRPRMADIAREAGVSLATVDRALNGRGVVREETRRLVLAIATRVGYVPEAAAPPAPASLHFDAILPGGANSYLQLLEQELIAAAASLDDGVAINVHRVEGFDPDALAQKLDEIETSDGVAVIALDHPLVRAAMRALRARAVPVATLVSDMSDIGSIGYVGIDNRASGRLAAQLLGRLIGERSGRVILFLGSRSYRGHEEREIAFRHVLEDEFPRLAIVPVRDARDDNQKTLTETLRLIDEHDDVVGIYNIAGGNRGIAEALQARPGRKPVFVAHELTDSSRRFLTSGLLDVSIDQNPRLEAREVLKLLAANAKGLPREPIEPIRITPIFRENLP